MTEIHQHEWRSISKKSPWKRSPQGELLMAYEVRVKRCDCGGELKIKTAPKGIWWKGINRRLGSVQTYPEPWKKTLSEAMRRRVEGDRRVSLDQMNRYGFLSGLTGAEVNQLVQTAVEDGLVERFDRYPKRTEKDIQIIIPQELLIILRGMLGLNKKDADEEVIDTFFDEWKKSRMEGIPPGEIIDRFADSWLEERAAILPFSEGPVRLKSFRTYIVLLKSLKEIALLSLSEERLPFRELSIRITGDSKGLASVKPYIKRLLGELEHYGIIDHSSHFFCRISLTGEVNGQTIDLSAAVDYVALTSSTARAFRPTYGNFSALLLIENLTSFEAIIPLLPKDIGIVWLSGFPPGYVRAFVENLLTFHPVPGRVWCDLDPDGIEIALAAGRWFERAGQPWLPIGMGKEFFIEESSARSLENRDKEKITALKTRSDTVIFHEVLDKMENSGRKVEQEAIDKNLLMIQLQTISSQKLRAR